MENIGIKSELVGPVWVGGLNGEGIINMKMVGLDYMFECGPTAREVLTVITAHVCGDCLVNAGVQDSRLAVQWMRRAASQGHLYAQFNLGEALINGYGVTQDNQEGIVWLKRAANGGVADAQVSLGLKYDEGIGVIQNHQTAVKWHLAAARQGNPNGRNNLAVAYAMGQGVTKDYVAAFAWFELARLAGHPSSGKYRDQVSKNMNPEQLGEAHRLVIQLGGE